MSKLSHSTYMIKLKLITFFIILCNKCCSAPQCPLNNLSNSPLKPLNLLGYCYVFECECE